MITKSKLEGVTIGRKAVVEFGGVCAQCGGKATRREKGHEFCARCTVDGGPVVLPEGGAR